MKRVKIRLLLYGALVTVLAVGAMFVTTSILTVGASDDVSPTDAAVSSVTDEREAAAAPQEEPAAGEIRTVTITREAPDLLLSSQTRRKNGSSQRNYRFIPSASYNGSYRSELDDNEKKLFDGLYQTYVVQRKNYTQKVHVDLDPAIPFDVVYSDAANDILSIDDLGDVEDAILSAAAAFFYDCPEAFWIRAFNYSIDADLTTGIDIGKGYVDWIEFEFTRASYPNAYDDLSAYDAGMAAAVNSIRQTRVNESVYETMKAIHDYIILHASYDYDALSGSSYTYGYAYTAAPLFTGKGRFVCEGYSKAFKLLCNQFGLNSALVSGTGVTSDVSGGPHMWNYAQIAGNWYGVDCTWDDGYAYQDGTPCPMYNYFLVGSTTTVRNDKTFAQDHINDGQVMSAPTRFSMVFPPLSALMYDHYIVDTQPKITLTTLGASIRISDPYGIRFGIQLKRDEALNSIHRVPEFGTLIIASGTLGDNELLINTPKVRKIRADNIYSQDETQLTYTGVLINIPRSFFGTKVKGRGYLIYIDNDTGEEHIVYSETIERSFNGVAQAAYDSYSRIEHPDASQRAIIEKLKGFLNH